MNKWEKYDPTKDYPDDIYWIMLEGETEARKSYREFSMFLTNGLGTSSHNELLITHVMLYGDEYKPEPPK